MFLAAMDAAGVGTAMPTVIASLGGLESYSWVFSAYVLASTASTPIAGKLSDLYGRKLFFLLGVGLFLFGSALCGAAQTMEQLIAFRAIQGLGGGILFPITLAIIGSIFPPERRGQMQGVMSSVWGVARVVGPALGGFIVDYASWGWGFYVNIPLGIMSIAMVIFNMKESKEDRGKPSVDYLGAASLSFGIAAILFAF